jgi:hypothetical protein
MINTAMMMLNPVGWLIAIHHSCFVIPRSGDFRLAPEPKSPLLCPSVMGLSLGKNICLCAAIIVVCSCDKHRPGEYPEVQRDKTQAVSPAPEAAASAETSPAPSTPAAKPTPADFFPTKPR